MYNLASRSFGQVLNVHISNTHRFYLNGVSSHPLSKYNCPQWSRFSFWEAWDGNKELMPGNGWGKRKRKILVSFLFLSLLNIKLFISLSVTLAASSIPHAGSSVPVLYKYGFTDRIPGMGWISFPVRVFVQHNINIYHSLIFWWSNHNTHSKTIWNIPSDCWLTDRENCYHKECQCEVNIELPDHYFVSSFQSNRKKKTSRKFSPRWWGGGRHSKNEYELF